jgi:hypothetical protein
MKRHWRMIVSCLALAVLASAVALSVMLVGLGTPAATPAPADAVALTSTSATVLAAAPAADIAAAQPAVIMSADFAVGYSSIGQLKQAADLVVRGEVIDVSYLDFRSSAYTKVTLKVSKCFKGNKAAGDEITILEVGGVTTMATIKGDKFGTPTKEDAETKVRVLLDGAPLTQVGEKCVYFLGAGDIGVVSDTYYVPMGAFQGRFKIDNGAAKRFVPNDWQGTKLTALPMDESSVDDTVSQAAAQ